MRTTVRYWFIAARYIVIPLHSLLPTVSQKFVFESPPIVV